MRRPLVVGNWKMNGTQDSVRQLVNGIVAGVDGNRGADIAVCVPFVFIPAVAEILSDTPVILGAQNVADQDAGAYTGEVSAAMLKEFGCRHAIVGHSERRTLYAESSELAARRFKKAVDHGLVPVLCVGETLEQRENGETFAVIDEQLGAVVKHAGVRSLANAVVAYEPVWAIGTGRTASIQQVQEVHHYIRHQIAIDDASVAQTLQILYGGSVEAANAADLFATPDIDGVLIGGASLDAETFLTICHST